MSIKQHIKDYIDSHAEPKRSEMQTLNELVLSIKPDAKLWFLDGKNDEGKVVSNPNIGYGSHTINYADGSTKEFYQIGLSANTSGISVYIMGIEDKSYLPETFGESLGKATVTGYCIRFRKLNDISVEVLAEAIRCGFANKVG